MDRQVRLSLYGDIDHPSPEYDMVWDLFQSQALTRLRDISLSSTPSRFAAHGMAASRFEHSVGVAYLARKLCHWKTSVRDQKRLLMAAALCHDIGSPPFSHISEIFMYDMTHRTHEEETETLLSKGTELYNLLKSYRVKPERVVSIINGDDPELSPLIAGSIDLDNVDNSLHLLRSMGYESKRYRPTELIKAYKWSGGKLYLDTTYLSEIVGWAETRRDLYGILHAEPHLSSASMLYRAIEFAYAAGNIKKDFFKMGESDALFYLANKAGKESAEIMDRTLRWRQYHLSYQKINADHNPKLTAIYSNWEAKKALCDELAERLGIDLVDIAIYIGADKGEKTITIPFIGDNSSAVSNLFSNREGSQRFSVFLPKRMYRLKDSQKLSTAIKLAVDNLTEEATDTPHAFF